MDGRKKILIGLAVAVTLVGAWSIYVLLNLPQPTAESLDIPVDVEIDPTQLTSTQDVSDIQNEIDSNNWQNAVVINGVTFIQGNDGSYLDGNGNLYDDGDDTITGIDSTVVYQDPSQVVYGSLDDSGNFIQDDTSSPLVNWATISTIF